MKVILIQNIKNLGNFGDIKEVADGYARNYLIPNRLVLPYSKENLSYIESLKKNIEIKREKEFKKLLDTKHLLEKNTVNVYVNVGEKNKVYGAITKDDIVDAIYSQIGIKIDKHNVVLLQPIKEIGVFNIKIKLISKKFPDITEEVQLKLWVKGKEK